ncbi:9745_t:CDS:10 [Paraglomus occultum]|uniref:9745_t:CDS:1 n=1 Tax=Paraglomus occultum TaxID=144539 RepID=A0A9N9BCP3_9GLOM|nr:9745_t:CDS:10 [Paraglomus occultum]
MSTKETDSKTLVGFSFASGRSLPALSAKDLQAARALLDQDDPVINDAILPSELRVNGRPKPILSDFASTEINHKHLDSRPGNTSKTVVKCGFSCASGRSLPAPSTEALEKAYNLVNNQSFAIAKDMIDDKNMGDRIRARKRSFIDANMQEINTKTPSMKRITTKIVNTEDYPQRTHPKNVGGNSYVCQSRKSLDRLHPCSLQTASKLLPKTFAPPSEAKRKLSLFNLNSLPQPRVKLKDFVKTLPLSFSENELCNLGLLQEIINMTPSSSSCFQFTMSEIDPSLPHEKRTWGARELLAELIRLGAEPGSIDERWVKNHYRWIVWKIASMIRCFPNEFQNWWCIEKVLEQLRYRYEREYNLAQRSILKRIIERDSPATYPMVLCISDIFIEDSAIIDTTPDVYYGIELTDCWYKIRAYIDQPLQRAILKSKLRIGSKLEICGAKLIGESEAVPALEVPSSLRLKLSANATRLARWDARLGSKNLQAYSLLRSISPDGGFVPAIDVIIIRKYPMLYREITADGNVVVRNAKEEEEARRKHEEANALFVQKIIDGYKDEQSKSGQYRTVGDNMRRRLSLKDIKDESTVEELYEIMQSGIEMTNIVEYLSGERRKLFDDFVRVKEQERMDHLQDRISKSLEEANKSRSVTPFFKVRICDYQMSKKEAREATLTIWQPDELLYDTIKEGNRYKVYSVTTANHQSYPLDHHALLRLSSTGRSTRWMEAPIDPNMLQSSRYIPRCIMLCDNLWGLNQKDELDLVVLILVILNETVSERDSTACTRIRKIMVVDKSKQMALIEIRGDRYNVLLEKSIVAIKNLQYCAYDAKYNVHFFTTTVETEFKTKPSEAYLQYAISELKQWLECNISIASTLELTASRICREC